METQPSNSNDFCFEPFDYDDPKTESSIFQIVKSAEWDNVVPLIISSIQNPNVARNEHYPFFGLKPNVTFTPRLNVPSEILEPIHLSELHNFLPYYLQYTNLKQIFSISKDGCALKTFYYKCEGVTNSLLVIKDDEGNVFGAFVTEQFKMGKSFYGTGETFLFTFYNGNKAHVYYSTQENEHYMYSDEQQICFGCSDDYFSLALENDFYSGYSKKTSTFNNLPLNKKDKFVIIKLELWAFENK